VGVVSFLLLLGSLSALAANQDEFSVLQVGQHTFKNVRVTTKARRYIFIMHSGGMASIKVSDLPPDIRHKLGYEPSAAKKQIDAALAAEKALVEKEGATLRQVWHTKGLIKKMLRAASSPALVFVASVTLLMGYLFFACCCLLICRKTGYEPGVIVFVPLLQALPLLRAASMSGWWFFALFIPGLNLVAYALWCANIVQARSKTFPLTILLLFPLTSWLAFIFLALSTAPPSETEEHYHEIMTLEHA